MNATTATTRKSSPSIRARASDPCLRRWALLSGLGILMIAALSIFAKFVVLDALVTPGDAASTANDVLSSKGLFQWGIAGWFLIAVLDVVVAWALFRAFKPVDRRIAMVGSWVRALYGAVLVVATTQLMGGLRLLGDSTATSSAVQGQALNKFEAFTDIWNVGLVLFGIHLLLAGYLAYRSPYVPKFVGALAALAGFGYLFDAAMRVGVDDPSFELSVITGLGEFVLGVWLVSKSHRISLPATTQVGERAMLSLATEATEPKYGQTTFRKTAALVGFLFLSATITFMAGNAMVVSYFSGDSPQFSTLLTGVLLQVYCAAAGAGIGVAMLPVLRPYSSPLARAYAALRIGEGLMIIGAGIYMVTAKQKFGNYDALIYLFTTTAGLIFSYLLYVSRLMPRSLAQLGLVGYAVLAIGIPIALMGMIELDRGWGLAFVALGGVFELLVPLLLVTKGFSRNRVEPGAAAPVPAAA